MPGGKSKSSTSSTQTNEAYAPVKPVIDQGASIMGAYLNDPRSNAVYGGQRVADLSADTRAGMDQMRASTGANQSMDYLSGVLNSGAGQGNPQVAAMQDQIRRQVMAANAGMFSNAGMTGGTQHQESQSRGLADGMAQPLFAAYEADRARQMQAAGLLPQIDQQRITNTLGAGNIQDSYNQNKINADRQLFEETRTAPMRAWSEVAPLATQIGSQFGTQTGNSTTTSQQKQSPMSMIAGGLMAGAGLMTGNPMMAMGGLGSMSGGGAGQSAAPWQMPSTPYASNGTFNINSLFGGGR
jgi:hypothetical protein